MKRNKVTARLTQKQDTTWEVRVGRKVRRGIKTKHGAKMISARMARDHFNSKRERRGRQIWKPF